MYCDASSSPVLEDGRRGGYNKIINNDKGVVTVGGTPVLGFISGSLGDVGGQNDIYGNSLYDVALSGKSNVKGENNWWGTPNDPKYQFQNPDLLDFDPWLTSDPNPNRAFTSPGIPGQGLSKGGGPGLVLSPQSMGPLERLALEKRTNGEFGEAAVILKSIVGDPGTETGARTWAIKQLLAVGQRLENPALAAYLLSLPLTSPDLLRTSKTVLPLALLHEGRAQEAILAFDENIRLYPSSGVECSAIYGKFLHELYAVNDTQAAALLQARLERDYPEDESTTASRTQLQNYIPPSPNQTVGNLRSGAPMGNIPRGFTLSANYPNPFNPSTTIEYTLAQDAHVSLVVYNLLGREVAVLERGDRTAGAHTVRFDASGLASGVYFYRLQSNGQSIVRKMVLIR